MKTILRPPSSAGRGEPARKQPARRSSPGGHKTRTPRSAQMKKAFPQLEIIHIAFFSNTFCFFFPGLLLNSDDYVSL